VDFFSTKAIMALGNYIYVDGNILDDFSKIDSLSKNAYEMNYPYIWDMLL